jgi:hypothetical protein
MSGIADWAEDALFDGALLFDGGDTGSRESIACFMHEGDRLGIVRHTTAREPPKVNLTPFLPRRGTDSQRRLRS